MLSKSSQRLEILKQQGFCVHFPDEFIDCEKNQKLVEAIESLYFFQKKILDKKLSSYKNFIKEIALKSQEDMRNYFLVCDSIVYIKNFDKDKAYSVFSNVKSQEDFLFLYENYYSKSKVIFIRTSQYLITARKNLITKKFQTDTVSLSLLDKDKKKLFTDKLLNKYIEKNRPLFRAGGIDIEFFKEKGFQIKGDINAAKGLIPFRI